MTLRQLGRFLLITASAAAVAHLAGALLVIAGLYAVYPQRIFNVHKWSDNNVENYRLVGTYLQANARSDRRPVIVFAGSSVSYGDIWPAAVTFPSLVAAHRPAATVLNASIIAADVSAINDWIVCGARRNQIHLDALVIELPVVNSLSYLIKTQRDSGQVPPLSVCETADSDPGYAGLAFTRLRGTGWLRFLWNTDRQLRGERQIKIDAGPKGYFASATDFAQVRGLFAGEIAQALKNAQAAADVVYAFPSPVFTPGVQEVGEDAAAVAEQLQAAYAACASVPGIRCIDPSGLYVERSYYANLTHLNQAGHRAMASLLNAQIAQ